MQLPFLDMLCTAPASLSLLHHPACRYCQPMSLLSSSVGWRKPAELMGEFFARFDRGLEEVQMAA